ncbi:aromatic amino acid hydroxylase [Paenibacillus roseipurpureus]|uniref:Aromatic amino acid hydroxylase n=1 Tax=Paenibacillus roseopurpureus TaxID=2918901 RepID=A0AA96LVN5_9BACL|nr:aromatic amino acid hydroxylase [Paenibacillus sp. MBLB1832]WNR46929.1 aromatic amino acid hydroxylase [Paenibacillus sp. MBLB1832]
MKMIPTHLKPFVTEQHYDRYTPIDHAVWRYVMRQNHHALLHTAHSAFVDGLLQSGIQTEKIPRVSEMNTCLSKIGWGAAIVNGLIPGSVFYELLANRILPIATEIRKLTNIEYTPAPDIIHEAAGHAPILFDREYRAYVQTIGSIGAKAFSMKENREVFEALRQLTIIKEDPKSTVEEIAAAQKFVEEKQNAIIDLSEAEKVSRLFWATVEYGLMGDMDNPKIYGAGLLSSVGESKHCFTEAVVKLPYSVEACIASPKTVTEMQTKLFVCNSFEELMAGAEFLANTMAFRVGGTESLEKALRSRNVATFEFNSSISVTGIVHALVKDKNGEAIYVNTTGETALSVHNQQLKGHGKDYHAKGFGTPIGMLQGNIALEACDDQALVNLSIVEGNFVDLLFVSGIRVSGRIKSIIKDNQKVILISFEDCTVTLDGHELFKKEWGTYDMAVGSRIVCAYPGAADPASYFSETLQQAETIKEPPASLTELEMLYQQVATIRENNTFTNESIQVLNDINNQLHLSYPNDWLLRLELLELAASKLSLKHLELPIKEELNELSKVASFTNLINNGLSVIYAQTGEDRDE